MELFALLVVLGIAEYQNYQTHSRLELLRKHVNERLARLEEHAEKNGWKMPFCSFGFFGAIDDWEV